MTRHDLVPPLAPEGHLALSEPELMDWGRRLGRQITPPLVVTLDGELGAGKTTLVRAICEGYGVGDDVTSPTFALVHEYTAPKSPVYHLDLYRLDSAHQLQNLGWDDIMSADALVLVEWPDRAGGFLPPDYLPIQLRHVEEMPDRRILYAGGHQGHVTDAP